MNEIDFSQLQEHTGQAIRLAADWQTEIAAGLAVLAVIAIILLARRNALRNRLRQFAPKLTLSSFQVSPLGRDGFLKLHNSGEPAILKRLHIHRRNDLRVHERYLDSKIGKYKDYALLIEATGQDRMSDEFLLTLEYTDEKGYTYRLVVDPAGRSQKKPVYIGRKYH